MSDNVNITEGTGTVIAADEVTRNATSEKQQIVKISLGAEGAFDTLVDSGQQTMANSLPVAIASDDSIQSKLGIVTETAPASDTASSGLNGRLQRIAQRISSLIALIPTALGQGTMATSFKVVLPSDQSAIPITTVVPGTAATNLGKAEDAAHASGDTGVMALGVRNDNAATTFGANGDYTPQAVDNAGAVLNSPRPASAANLTNVSSSATSVSLLASTAGRKGAIIFNDSTQILYVKFGATASATSFTYKLAAGDTLELPSPTYTGAIDGIWASANGNARITELT